MARILTGIQSTGTPHLGNILGAIRPAIEMAEHSSNESFLFIADMHSLTQIKNGDELRQNTYATAAAWLAFGLILRSIPRLCAGALQHICRYFPRFFRAFGQLPVNFISVFHEVGETFTLGGEMG